MQDQDSEHLFGDDVYSLLREDSLLTRTGSNNFATLLESNDVPVEQEQQQHNHHLQQQQQPVVFAHDVNGQAFYYQDISQVVLQQQQGPEDTQVMAQDWEQVEATDEIQQVSNGPGQVILQHPHLQQQQEESGPSTLAPDSSSSLLTPPHPPSIQPWPGKHIFSLSLPIDNKDRNKWCYSQARHKLYVCPNVAVPVNIMLQEWTANASLLITPVYKDSRHRVDPVSRCYNCKSGGIVLDPNLVEHVVQVEGDRCEYLLMNDRHVVSTPLHPPPLGEVASTLLVKLMCLTSCVGGPNRRPFCLVFSLRDNTTGAEIGRQVLDVKCCKCPSRDLSHDDKGLVGQRVGACDREKLTKVQVLASTIAVGQKRKRPNIKLEPGTATRYENVLVPIEFVSKVKEYVNGLVGMQHLKRSQPALLPFPDQN